MFHPSIHLLLLILFRVNGNFGFPTHHKCVYQRHPLTAEGPYYTNFELQMYLECVNSLCVINKYLLGCMDWRRWQ